MEKKKSNLKVKFLAQQDRQVWDAFVSDSPWGDILQLWGWGEVKKLEGWKPLRLAVLDGANLVLICQLLLKKVPLLGNYAYCPHGPVFHSVDKFEESLNLLTKFIVQNSKIYDLMVLEIEPKIARFLAQEETQNSRVLAKPESLTSYFPREKLHPVLNHYSDKRLLDSYIKEGYRITGRNMQPVHKLYYDLTKPEDELLKLCKKSTRYNIKLSERKGVEVRSYYPNDVLIDIKLKEFYNLLKETQKRANGYPVRPFSAFKKLIQEFKESKNLILYEARYKDEVIGMNITQRTKYWSSSFYAGSNRKHSKVKALYALRWKSIMEAKKYGSTIYDFWGVIPNSKQHKGYSQHKISFGGIRMDTYGLLALPVNPIKYHIWNWGIWARTKGKITLKNKSYQFLLWAKNSSSSLFVWLKSTTRKKIRLLKKIWKKIQKTKSKED